MDEETRKKALDWLDLHWKESHRCPICFSNDWQIGDIVFWSSQDEPAGFAARLSPGNYRRYPVLQVICNICGYTHTFNARIVGLAPERIDVVVQGLPAYGLGYAHGGAVVTDSAPATDSVSVGHTGGANVTDEAPAVDEIADPRNRGE